MRDSVITYQGKTYVSSGEFARRMNVRPQLISNYVKDGSLLAFDVHKNGCKYLDWETQQVSFKIMQGKKASRGGKGRPKKVKAENPIMHESNIKEPKVSDINLKLEDNSIKDIEVSNSVLDLSKINPYDHPDCWLIGEGGLPLKGPNGLPRIDYELLKTKVTVQTYQIKLDKEVRNVIPKEELIVTVQGITTVLKSSVENIPYRYAASIIAICESITGHEFTPTEHTKVMNVMRNVPKEIFPSIQVELEKMVSDAESEN